MALAFGMVLSGCNTLQTVEISGEPARIVYGQGQDFDTTGLSAILTYKKGNTENMSGVHVSGYDKGKPGEQTVTVSYQQKKVGSSAADCVKSPYIPSAVWYTQTEGESRHGIHKRRKP